MKPVNRAVAYVTESEPTNVADTGACVAITISKSAASLSITRRCTAGH